MHLRDQRSELLVAHSTRRRLAFLRGVVPGRGDPDAVLCEYRAEQARSRTGADNRR